MTVHLSGKPYWKLINDYRNMAPPAQRLFLTGEALFRLKDVKEPHVQARMGHFIEVQCNFHNVPNRAEAILKS